MAGTRVTPPPADAAAPPGAAAAQFLRCYLRNLRALYARDAELAGALEELPGGALPPLELTREGSWTTLLTADDGRPVYAHSRYQPQAEARALIEARLARGRTPEVPPEATRNVSPAHAVDPDELEGQCFVFAGVGLGYALAEIEARFHRPYAIVIEDNLALLKAALFVTDVSPALEDGRLTFLTRADKGLVHERLGPLVTLLLLGTCFVTPPYARRCGVAFQTKMSGLLRDFVSYARLQLVSAVRNARASCENAALNLPTYLRHPGVEVLAGRAQGYPAILVAAGPSLARVLDQLPALRERAVIIAAQTVLRTLLERGVQPHFVTSLDYHEISAQFFRDLGSTGDTALVAESKVTWRVPDAWPGRVHMLYSDFLADVLREAAPPRAALKAGSTVAHLSFYLAEHLGCDPIILVGQDLSFSDGLYYPPGMQIERIWQPELGRFTTVEMKQWERIVRFRGGLHTVEDIHGRQVYTDDQLFTYAEQFQSDFAVTRARVIHACEGGMRLQHTEVMSLRDAVEQFCERPLPAEWLPSVTPQQEYDGRGAVAALEQRIAELREMHQVAVETQGLLARLVDLVDRPAEFNRLVVEVERRRARMQRYDRTYSLVGRAAQLAELRRIQADRAIRDELAETSQTARRRLRRDREHVAAVQEGCAYLLELLPKALARLQERRG
ncbi:MAG: motility associated factor glycosyltransferase family protein [Phycisphaerales bacterium]|nr:motility associated factor glycosyltransferase family protein [Phycisphaerales bacterium]